MKALQGKVKYIYFYVTPTFTPLVFLGKKPEEIPAGFFSQKETNTGGNKDPCPHSPDGYKGGLGDVD